MNLLAINCYVNHLATVICYVFFLVEDTWFHCLLKLRTKVYKTHNNGL